MAKYKEHNLRITNDQLEIIEEIFSILARENIPFKAGLSILVVCVIQSISHANEVGNIESGKVDEKQLLADLTMGGYRVKISKE